MARLIGGGPVSLIVGLKRSKEQNTTMKTLARVAATFTFICFFFPGAWLIFAIAHANPIAEPIAFVLGFVLLGLAFSLGPFLWLAGEMCCPKQDNK
jgi:hypothetical protein